MARAWRPLALTAVLLLPVAHAADHAQPATPAPDVELQGPAGETIRLADLKGKVVLVDFWASWCAPCKESFPVLDALYKERHGDGLEVLAVNVDEQRKQADEFLSRRPHEMPVFFDPKGRSPEAFRVEGMPSSFVIDRRGQIRFKHVGYTAALGPTYAREVAQLLAEEVPVAKE